MNQHAQIAPTTRSCSTETHKCACKCNTKENSVEIQTLFSASCMFLDCLFKCSHAKNENNCPAQQHLFQLSLPRIMGICSPTEAHGSYPGTPIINRITIIMRKFLCVGTNLLLHFRLNQFPVWKPAVKEMPCRGDTFLALLPKSLFYITCPYPTTLLFSKACA